MCMVSCRSNNNLNSTSKAIGDNCNWNESKSYYLCVDTSEQSLKNIVATSSTYQVFDLVGNLEVEGEFGSGSVAWLSDDVIVVFKVPGTMRQGETRDDYRKVYILESKEWRPYKEYIKQ